MKYDYLVVGSGLYGAVFAREAADRGKKVLVIDKRPNVAGNIYTETVEGIYVHKYGAHVSPILRWPIITESCTHCLLTCTLLIKCGAW